MANPLTDKIDVRYFKVQAFFDERWPDRRDFLSTGERVHKTKDAALAAAAQEARSQGAPEDARVIVDYDIYEMVDRVLIDWHAPVEAGQPGLLRKDGYVSFRLSEIPR